jgi:hypothetical protein
VLKIFAVHCGLLLASAATPGVQAVLSLVVNPCALLFKLCAENFFTHASALAVKLRNFYINGPRNTQATINADLVFLRVARGCFAVRKHKKQPATGPAKPSADHISMSEYLKLLLRDSPFI